MMKRYYLGLIFCGLSLTVGCTNQLGADEPVDTNTTMPVAEAETVERQDWATFASTYGYSFQYPPDLTPSAVCGSEGEAYTEPVEGCDHIRLTLAPRFSALYGALELAVADNAAGLSAREYAEAILQEASALDLTDVNYNGHAGVTTTFRDTLKQEPAPDSGSGQFYDNTQTLLVIELTDSQILLVNYPAELCEDVRVNEQGDTAQYKVDCYVDEKVKLWEQVAQTLDIQ